MKALLNLSISCLLTVCANLVSAQGDPIADTTFAGLKMRSIGPAFMSGRIADIAVHPEKPNTWIVGVGSGGVWKTVNAGTTWQPVFDKQTSYSIGCVTIDGSNPHIVWVGTGENVGGRHVGYGDGIYRSLDGGASWKNMGLKESEHISKIIVHPDNSDVLWVAAQGPLWSKGGQRGVYKSDDGGKNWKRTLGDDAWVGATDLLIDPRNPLRLYAATWQRHRNVAAYLGGGPGTAIYRSEDGGETWQKLSKGIPGSNKGKIGLAISPQNPDVVYAAIELDRRKGAVYRSADRGTSWTKGATAVAGGTGPHYYQELYASPHKFDRIYLADVRVQVSEDGGKTFRRMKEQYKHSDNHAIAFRADDPNYLMVGTDGGLYESFDLAQNWRLIGNLPVTQFYKVAVDDAAPFYNVYGGTQDNNTQGGPSRTDNRHGIRNADWYITLWGDGHQPATEPGNPDIMYSEWQRGNLVRVDRTTSEIVYIQPQNKPDEEPERFNWDAPILVSPHKPSRIYFCSQRVWRSEDRGDSWTTLSGDLTRNEERLEMPIMGKRWSWDSPWDVLAMSEYNTITSISESPKQEGLIYVGTDDGFVQVTEDGGANWRRTDLSSLPGVPATAFVNDIKADLHDANTVYLCLDNHKYGDLEPYVFKSTDRGKRWTSIRSNLPDRTLVWRIVQDHVKADLLFLATEFGIYFSLDRGDKWVKIKGGLPTISFRDLAIQKRENDLVAASFGRGFYILDDYSVLREVDADVLRQEATLFSTRKSWWYVQRPVLGFGARGSQGAAHFSAPNPPYGAVFTYYLKEGLQTDKKERKNVEKKLSKAEQDIPFPGWEELEAEGRQAAPRIWLTVSNDRGDVVRKINAPSAKGFHRVAWNLRYPSAEVITDRAKVAGPGGSAGFLAPPGKYSVALSKEVDGIVTPLSSPQSFDVVKMRDGVLSGSSIKETAAFWRSLEDLQQQRNIINLELGKAIKLQHRMSLAVQRAPSKAGALEQRLFDLRQTLLALQSRVEGNKAKAEIGERRSLTASDRLTRATWGVQNSTYGPTPTNIASRDMAAAEFSVVRTSLDRILSETLPALENDLKAAGAPWVEGMTW